MNEKNRGPQYSTDWFSRNIPQWDSVFDMVQFRGKNDLTFLEIGCFEGRSTNYLLDYILTGENSKIHVVDLFGYLPESSEIDNTKKYNFMNIRSRFEKNTEKNSHKVIIHHDRSSNVLRHTFEKNTFDFIYIDGSHEAQDVLSDAIMCHDLLKSGGVMIFDDFGWEDHKNLHPTKSPALGIISFMQVYELLYDILFVEYQVGLLKK